MSSLEDAFRTVLAARLPKGHAWAAWIDGTVRELAVSVPDGMRLTAEEKATILDALREIPDIDERMAQYRPSRQRDIDDRRALAARLEAAS